MQVTAAVKKLVEAKIKDCIRIAEAHYKQKFAYPKSVSYNVRGATAGLARPSQWSVDFNATLLMENLEDFIARTVPHEMAHLFDYQMNPEGHHRGVGFDRYGRVKRKKRDIHGYSWKMIMMVLGVNPERCHNYDVATVKAASGRSQHVWVCRDCQTRMILGPARHKKMHTGATRYWKRGCGHHSGGYEYVGLLGKEKPVTAKKPVTIPSPPPIDQHPMWRGGNPVVPAAASKAPATPKAPAGKVLSKLDRCRAVYDPSLSREQNIRTFTQLGCTPAGAATYYAKIKKEG